MAARRSHRDPSFGHWQARFTATGGPKYGVKAGARRALPNLLHRFYFAAVPSNTASTTLIRSETHRKLAAAKR